VITLKTKIIIVAGISIIIALIAGMQSIEISSNEAYAEPRSGERHAPPWIKEVAGMWSTGDLVDGKYLNSIEWLIKNGIILVDTASAESSDISDIAMDIRDLSKENKKLLKQNKDLNKRLDDLESSLPVTVYHVFTPEPIDDCTLTGGGMGTSPTVIGWCPDGIQQNFKLTGPKEVHTSEAFIVWTINFVGNDHCNVAWTELDDGGTYSEIFIDCDSPPMEGSPLTLFVIDDPNSGGFVELDTIMSSP
jgi:hypothetical protein